MHEYTPYPPRDEQSAEEQRALTPVTPPSAAAPQEQPAPATVPLQQEGAMPTSTTPTEWWTSQGSLPPAPPPYGVAPYGGAPYNTAYAPYGAGPVQTKRSRWPYILVALALIAMLAVGLGVGAAAVRGQAGTVHSVTIGAQSAPAVTVASSTSDLEQNVESVIQAVQPSVVEITSTSGRGMAIGSGDVLTKDGYIVTNDHVVAGYSTYSVKLSNGQSLSAQIVGQDAQDDLAVLKVSATNLQPIAFADSAKAHVGQFAIAVGNPLGLQQSATFGIVSALNRSASEAPSGPAGELPGLIQTSAPINPGNSGGALVDLQGRLIGIPTLGATDTQTGGAANGIGFAIPSDRVQFVTTQLIQSGHLSTTGQGFLGIIGEDVTPQLASANNLSSQSGVLVTGFASDASGKKPAQQAGLRTGDIITAVNGQPVADNGELASALLSLSPGTQINLTVSRSSGNQTVQVTLGERPTNLQG